MKGTAARAIFILRSLYDFRIEPRIEDRVAELGLNVGSNLLRARREVGA